ncbi:Sel1 repeat-containing protein 1B [Paragonimus heterotremus]|uniref:Sel1 repeat-containing protein 1B n=1 Tax=Paragonimus heterotremus TaxID=100268 RepID=A0A8J4WGU2_9TREM|nr:Sel1 repeat-containing protein 1B [Paragonimus heterotremus]
MAYDSGILEFKDEAEVEDYMRDLGLRFEFGCRKEKNAQSCHSLAQWYETYKHSPKRCAEILKPNCFEMKYGDSCLKYGVFKLFGKTDVARDPLEAYQAFEFGCKSAQHSKCCQAAGRLIAEGIVSHSPTLMAALPLFERGCKLGLAESCFHLGGASITLATKLEDAQSKTKVADSPDTLRAKALAAWSEGCKLGHELSCRNVARMYAIGDGVPVDKEKSDEFRLIADKFASQPDLFDANPITSPSA